MTLLNREHDFYHVSAINPEDWLFEAAAWVLKF